MSLAWICKEKTRSQSGVYGGSCSNDQWSSGGSDAPSSSTAAAAADTPAPASSGGGSLGNIAIHGANGESRPRARSASSLAASRQSHERSLASAAASSALASAREAAEDESPPPLSHTCSVARSGAETSDAPAASGGAPRASERPRRPVVGSRETASPSAATTSLSRTQASNSEDAAEAWANDDQPRRPCAGRTNAWPRTAWPRTTAAMATTRLMNN